MKVLTAAEAALFDALVAPRYLSPFVRSAMAMLAPRPSAVVAQFGCRTGLAANELAERLSRVRLRAIDPSPSALKLARTKALAAGFVAFEYLEATEADADSVLTSGAFTHALAIHPHGDQGDHGATLGELYRVLERGGQAVFTLPIRGSFPELYDMLREYAVRYEDEAFGRAIDAALTRRPNPEALEAQVEAAGFRDVAVSVDLVGITFDGGRDFLEDPITRLVVGPDLAASLAAPHAFDAALAYATEAIGRYWTELPFTLTVNVGTVSASKP